MTENHSKESKRNAIVLLIDGLSPAYLSPYGCTWVETPAFDQLASESLLFERAVTETVDADASLESFFYGRHPALRPSNGAANPLLRLVEEGVSTLLLTDDPQSAAGLSDAFDRVVELPEVSIQPFAASDVSATHLGSCFARALEELPCQASPFLSVMHLSSLSRTWDAPPELREKYRDEEDPDPIADVKPPCRSGQFDPDEILAVTHAYAAQVETLDTCLGVLLDELQRDGLFDSTVFMLAGLRGFPLGRQHRIGHDSTHLGSDATAVPLLVRPVVGSEAENVAARTHQVTTTCQWFSGLQDWILTGQDANWEGSGASAGQRDFAVIIGSNARAIWTPAWLMVQNAQDRKLFVKPDDRWDVNPVQDRCRWVADDLEDLLDDLCSQLAENQSPTVDSLADVMLYGLE